MHTSKGRAQQNAYLIEGHHLVAEAIAAQCSIRQIMATDPAWLLATHPGEKIHISQAVAKEIATTQESQGIFAVVDRLAPPTLTKVLQAGQRFIVLDRLQDPGNVGTIIRTADAAGFDGVILGHGTVEVFNEKVIRASQGSIWHLPLISCDLSTIKPVLKEYGVALYATALSRFSLDYRQADYRKKFALIFGNEGDGVTSSLLEAADQILHIPMPGKAESLNVAVSAAIMMFASLEQETKDRKRGASAAG